MKRKLIRDNTKYLKLWKYDKQFLGFADMILFTALNSDTIGVVSYCTVYYKTVDSAREKG